MLRLIIISILFFSLGFSQNEEIKIAKVEVEGNEITSKKTIIFTAGLREGQTITTADFPRAIKRLWKLNLFQDVQIHFNEETEEDSGNLKMIKISLLRMPLCIMY